jgi:hypothetical protein
VAFFGPLGALSDAVMDEFGDAELRTVHRFLARMGTTMRTYVSDAPSSP